jgi:hypothetical protein
MEAYPIAFALQSTPTTSSPLSAIKSTIRLLEALEALYPFMVCIRVFLDNASYHHAKLVKEWLSECSLVKIRPVPDRAVCNDLEVNKRSHRQLILTVTVP